MMRTTKTKFVGEYPINASSRLLFPYLSTASGLSEWFCDDVKIEPNKVFNFIWDNSSHYAELTGFRSNRSVRFMFLDDNRQHVSDPSYIDFSIESSELTQEQFLKVVDYSDEEDLEELAELWEHLMQNLREIIGG